MLTDEMSPLIQGNINLQLKAFTRDLKIYFKDEKKTEVEWKRVEYFCSPTLSDWTNGV